MATYPFAKPQKPWRQNEGRSAASRGYGKDHARWRAAVLTLFTSCVDCGTTENLEADHQVPVSQAPHLRYVVTNGVARCKSCHSHKTATKDSKRQ